MKANRTTRDFENALWEILDITPFAEVTVDQICSVALIHRSSFYRYFDDKVDLLKQTLSTMLRRNLNASSNPDLVDQIVSFIIDNRTAFRNISIIGGNNSINLDLLTLIGKIILERPDSGTNNLIDALHRSKNPDMMSYILAGALTGVFVYCDEYNYDIPRKDVVQIFNSVIKHVTNNEF